MPCGMRGIASSEPNRQSHGRWARYYEGGLAHFIWATICHPLQLREESVLPRLGWLLHAVPHHSTPQKQAREMQTLAPVKRTTNPA